MADCSTAWSVAGIPGPCWWTTSVSTRSTQGIPPSQAYNVTLYIMAGLLVIGFIANSFVKAVDKRHHMARDTDTEADRALARGMPAGAQAAGRA